MTRPASRLPHLCLLGLVALILGGCNLGHGKTVALRLDFPDDAYANAVDIKSFGGRVKIVVNPHATGIGIQSTVRISPWANPSDVDAIMGATSAIAEVVEENGFATLRIDATTAFPDDTAAGVELVITMPSVQGTRVQMVRGTTELVNVGGAIQVNQVQGNITVRTSEPLTDPVLLVTGDGNIYTAIDPGSRGDLDLESHAKKITVRARKGSIHNINFGRRYFNGSLNGGGNPITMKADGKILMIIRDNAGDLINPR